MRLLDHYPLITTPRLHDCAAFYTRHFGFEAVFSASWFVLLQRSAREGEPGISLAFMSPEHPSSPPGPESFTGLGALLTIQVDDAHACEAELRTAGVAISHPARREAWGQVRLQCVDPGGLVLDLCEQVEPEAGFWARYMAGGEPA
jgi:uncharacterized glyoxalase superfamily protein PhnB